MALIFVMSANVNSRGHLLELGPAKASEGYSIPDAPAILKMTSLSAR